MEKSKTLYAIPASIFPTEKRIYVCDMPYDGTEIMTKVLARWSGAGWDVPFVKFWYSETPPPELKKIIDWLEQHYDQLKALNDKEREKHIDHQVAHSVQLSFKESDLKSLLKHL